MRPDPADGRGRDGVPSAGRSVGSPASGDGRPDGAGADYFHLFVYGTLRTGGRACGMLEGSQLIGEARIEGTLYDLGDFPVLMLYGGTAIEGEVWRCPVPLLWELDDYEGVGRGLFRRVAIVAGELPCWTYVAGPKLGPQLTPDRRLATGIWTGS